MNISIRIEPEYFEMLKKGTKTIDYRQFELIEFENNETGEKLVFNIEQICRVLDASTVRREYPDIPWILARDIYGIELGRRL